MHRGLCNIPSASALTPIPHTHELVTLSLTHTLTHTDEMKGEDERTCTDTYKLGGCGYARTATSVKDISQEMFSSRFMNQ